MSQSWTEDVFATSHVGNTDLQNMENNFQVIKSLWSGGGAPANDIAGMPWFDTTKKLLKIRNNADSAWYGVMYGPATVKIWIYANAATDGWAIDAAVTDMVLALKGGAQAYNRTGGGSAGSWTQPDGTISVANLPSHSHGGYSGYYDVTHGHSFTGTTPSYGSTGVDGAYGTYLSGQNNNLLAVGISDSSSLNHRHTVAAEGSGTAHQHGTTYRPTAAVGTLQYPDV